MSKAAGSGKRAPEREGDSAVAKKGRKSPATTPAEQKMKEEIEKGGDYWTKNSWGGNIVARKVNGVVIGGIVKAQYNFRFTNCMGDQLVEGKTFFKGYDGLYRAIHEHGGVEGFRKLAEEKNARKESKPSPSIIKASVLGSAPSTPLLVHRLRGGSEAKKHLTGLVTDNDWAHGTAARNRITYSHFCTVLEDEQNYVYYGCADGEVVSLFCFRLGGKEQRDMTITLLWTKAAHRRKGLCKMIMGIGMEDFICQGLPNSNSSAGGGESFVMSGTSPTSSSQYLYKSLNFQSADDGFCISVGKLLESLEANGDKMSARGWERNIVLWDANRDTLPLHLQKQRDELFGDKRAIIDLTGDDGFVNIVYVYPEDKKPAAIAGKLPASGQSTPPTSTEQPSAPLETVTGSAGYKESQKPDSSKFGEKIVTENCNLTQQPQSNSGAMTAVAGEPSSSASTAFTPPSSAGQTATSPRNPGGNLFPDALQGLAAAAATVSPLSSSRKSDTLFDEREEEATEKMRQWLRDNRLRTFVADDLLDLGARDIEDVMELVQKHEELLAKTSLKELDRSKLFDAVKARSSGSGYRDSTSTNAALFS